MRREIRERMVRTEAGRRAFGIPLQAAKAIRRPARHTEPGGPFGWRTRAWHADEFHWRLETDLPGGGIAIVACNGRRRLSIGGPPGSGLVWDHRVGTGPPEHDPRWFALANDHYWTFYVLLTDEICGISGELSPADLTVEDPVTWGAGKRGACRGRRVPTGTGTPTL